MLLVKSMLSDIQAKIFFFLWSVLFNRIQATLPPSAWKQSLAVQSCHWYWKKLCTQRSSLGIGWGRGLAIYLVYQNCCLSSVAVANKKYCWYFTVYHVLIFTLAFKTWIYLTHCFITKDFSNFILIVSKLSTSCVQLGLVICLFSTCVLGLLKEQWKLIILLSDAVLLTIWLWHYPLASVISLCLRLLIQIIHQKNSFSASTLCVRTWTINCFYFCHLWGDVAAYWWLTKPPSSLLGSWDSWLRVFTSSGYSLILFPSL